MRILVHRQEGEYRVTRSCMVYCEREQMVKSENTDRIQFLPLSLAPPTKWRIRLISMTKETEHTSAFVVATTSGNSMLNLLNNQHKK